MNEEFKGIIPPVITCFGKDGKFDEAAQREVVSFQAKHIDGFYPCGTYGSGPLMTTDERKRVAEVVIDEKGSCKVIVHVGAVNTTQTVELARHAQSAGADAVGAIPPYYLAGVKDSAFDLVNFYLYLLKVKRPDFTFIIGTEAIAAPALDAGASGVISGLANVFPELMASFYQTWKQGDSQKTGEAQVRVVKARAILKYGPTLTMTYAVLRMRGINAGYPRRP
jgi:dihydrodipicolinate synthase/N-acetylneuraminate lyase